MLYLFLDFCLLNIIRTYDTVVIIPLQTLAIQWPLYVLIQMIVDITWKLDINICHTMITNCPVSKPQKAKIA